MGRNILVQNAFNKEVMGEKIWMVIHVRSGWWEAD